MEGGGLEHMVISFAACAVAVLVGLSAFAVSGRSERASPMFVLAAPTPGAYFDFVVSILMENHGICDILTYCGGSAPFETQLANASGLATNYSPGPCGKSLLDYLCLTGASTFGCTENSNPNSDACTRLAWQSPNIVDRLELHVAHAQRMQRHGRLQRRRRRCVSVQPGPENPREHGLHDGTGRALHHLRRGRQRPRDSGHLHGLVRARGQSRLHLLRVIQSLLAPLDRRGELEPAVLECERFGRAKHVGVLRRVATGLLSIRLPLEPLLHRGRKRGVQRQPATATRFPGSRDT